MEQLNSLQSRLEKVTENFRNTHPSFDDAYTSYTIEYGENSIKVHEPFKISQTIDPVTIILGRNTPLTYRDSKHMLTGGMNSISIEPNETYILGRRTETESMFLLVWSGKAETEITQYDSHVRTIPSRIHAAIFTDRNDVFYTDLGSSSGSILAGETTKPEPFVALYATPRVEVHKVTIDPKYGHRRTV
jgi:pSer/pThr/pTyr-binding forkhead associated (FHA) protein